MKINSKLYLNLFKPGSISLSFKSSFMGFEKYPLRFTWKRLRGRAQITLAQRGVWGPKAANKC